MTSVRAFDEIDDRSPDFSMSREELAGVAGEWQRVSTTPVNVAALLAEARRLFVGGAVTYDNFAAASLKALHAADLALKLKLELPATDRRTLGQLIAYERDRLPVLSDRLRGWYTHLARRFRNKLSHPSEPMAFTPGMSEAILESVHAAIAEMFGDAAEGSSAGLEQQ